MKPTSARKKLKTSLMAASLIAMVGAFGCGKVKTQDEKVLKIEQNSNSGTTDTLMSIATLLELYGRPGADSGASAKALNADEIKNILKKLKTSIETALHVDNLPVDQIIDTVVKVFPSLVKGVTPQDVYNGVLNNFPLVSWYQGKTDITQEDLLSKITSQFKEASPAARDGLYKVLLKFDNVSLAGNGDNLLNVKEMAAPILIMSALSKHQISKDDIFKNSEGLPIEKMTKRSIESKIEQQIYGRYLVSSYKNLSEDDIKLELMQLSLKFYQSTLVSSVLGIQGELYPKVLKQALQALTGIETLPVSKKLIKLYDSSVMIGDENTFINSIELFNLATDIEVAHEMHEKNPYSIYENPEVLSSLVSAFPRVSKSVFAPVKGKPSKIWNDLLNFDDKDRGGDNDKTVSDSEMAIAIASLRLVDLIYEIYDLDSDGKISREEAESLFEKIGIDSACVRNGFFADIRFSSALGSPGVLIKLWLTCAFSFVTKAKLTPVEFYTRLVNALPIILDNMKASNQAK